MSKPRPSRDVWQAARAQWEADLTESFESIAKVVGVSRVAVSKRAAKEGWERVQSLSKIVEKAQLQADKVTAQLSQVTGLDRKTTVAAAIDVRASVLERHRADWAEHRKLFTLGSIEVDFEAGKKAKISAEMVSIRQKGEREAYGIATAVDPERPPDDKPEDITTTARRVAFLLAAGMKAKAD